MAKIMILVTITRMVVICIPHFQACKKYAKKVQWLEKIHHRWLCRLWQIWALVMGDNFHEHTDDDDEDKIQRISNENSFVYEGFVSYHLWIYYARLLNWTGAKEAKTNLEHPAYKSDLKNQNFSTMTINSKGGDWRSLKCWECKRSVVSQCSSISCITLQFKIIASVFLHIISSFIILLVSI